MKLCLCLTKLLHVRMVILGQHFIRLVNVRHAKEGKDAKVIQNKFVTRLVYKNRRRVEFYNHGEIQLRR